MRPIDYFQQYCDPTGLQLFRGEDLPGGVPELPGIYAWYAICNFGEFVRQEAHQTGLEAVVNKQVFTKLQRQPYIAKLSSKLEPSFEGSLEHTTRSHQFSEEHSQSAVAIDDSVAALSSFFSNCFSPFFSSPIYIGKAVKQSIRSRVVQHLALLEKYSVADANFLDNARNQIVKGGITETDSVPHTFSIEAASRGISQAKLVLITLDQSFLTSQPDSIFTSLEEICNRVSFPIFGRR